MKLEQRSGQLTFNENEITVTLDLRQSKKFYGEPFETESIDADLFVKSIESEAPVLFNHRKEQIVSDDYDVRANNGVVTVNVRLDERNMYANTILSLREKSQKRLGCSFGFRCLKDEIRNKHREVKELIVSEISILSCESAYPSSVRCLDNDEVRELTMEELQNMIDQSIAKALQVKQEETKEEPKQEQPKVEEVKEEPKQEQPKVEEKIAEQAKEEPKQVEVKLDTDGLKAVFNDFLEGFKAVIPQQKEEPKQEEVKEESKQEIVKEEPKVEEPKQEEVKPALDDEKLKEYQKMLEELN